MSIALIIGGMCLCGVGLAWMERHWFSERWWMLEPHAGSKFIAAWLLCCVAGAGVPLIVTAVVCRWP